MESSSRPYKDNMAFIFKNVVKIVTDLFLEDALNLLHRVWPVYHTLLVVFTFMTRISLLQMFLEKVGHFHCKEQIFS